MPASLILALALVVQAPATVRNTWEKTYATSSAESFAATFEEPTRALFRYRQAIAGLMQIQPGMTVAEVGAGAGYLARFLVQKVGAGGHVLANELEPRMVEATSTGFQPGSVDAVAVVYAFSFFDYPADMLRSLSDSLKPNGLLLIVDSPREGLTVSSPGMDADEVLDLTAAAGFTRLGESGVVPGHYSLIFRKKQT